MGIQRSAALWVKKTRNVCLKRVKECQRGFCQRAGSSSARRLCGFRRVTASARLSVCLPPIGSRKQETGKQEVGSADSPVCISKEMTRGTPRGAGGVDGWVSQCRLFVFVGVKGRSAHAEGGRGRVGLTRGSIVPFGLCRVSSSPCGSGGVFLDGFLAETVGKNRGGWK